MSADTEQKGAHTGLPWHVEGPDPFGDYNILHPSDSLAVAAAVSNMRPATEVAANAMLIVRAANNHADLVAALRDTLKMVEAAHRQLGMWNDDNKRIVQARAALAKATQS